MGGRRVEGEIVTKATQTDMSHGCHHTVRQNGRSRLSPFDPPPPPETRDKAARLASRASPHDPGPAREMASAVALLLPAPCPAHHHQLVAGCAERQGSHEVHRQLPPTLPPDLTLLATAALSDRHCTAPPRHWWPHTG